MTRDMKINPKPRGNRGAAAVSRASLKGGAQAKRQWSAGHVAAAFLIGAVIGLAIGLALPSGDSESPAAAAPMMQQQPPAAQQQGGMNDSYGRPPGDEHYGHNHP